MSHPKHKWGFIVLGPWRGALADNGQGMFVEMSFAEVFLDRKAAEWVQRNERKFLRDFGSIQSADQHASYEEAAERVKIIRIALPGTYPQFQIPGRLERKLRKDASL
ncbi:MAG: hypothetical protein WAN65_00415 [Candidatus Sulfotelmatobacter sp.]